MSDLLGQMTNVVRSLDGLSLRQKVIASNLANVSTPGFKRREVSFEEQLQRAASAGSFEPEVTVDRSPGNADGNNVVAESEVGDMLRVELTYQTLTRAITHKAQLLRLAMSNSR